MAAAAAVPSGAPRRRGRPATTPEERELILQNKAFDLAEKQLDAGTASSQVITQLLKGGGVREQLELERLRKDNRLLEAKIDALQSAVRLEGLMEEALEAFRSYQGTSADEHDD